MSTVDELVVSEPAAELVVSEPAATSELANDKVTMSDEDFDLIMYDEIKTNHAKYYLNADLQVEFTLPEGVYEGGTVMDMMIFSNIPDTIPKSAAELFLQQFTKANGTTVNGMVLNELVGTEPGIFDYLMKNATKTRVNKLLGAVTDKIGYNPVVSWVRKLLFSTAIKSEDDFCYYIRRENVCNRLQIFLSDTMAAEYRSKDGDFHIPEQFNERFRKFSLMATDHVMQARPIPVEIMDSVKDLFKEVYEFNTSLITVDLDNIPPVNSQLVTDILNISL
jgi:hypothetical protein